MMQNKTTVSQRRSNLPPTYAKSTNIKRSISEESKESSKASFSSSVSSKNSGTPLAKITEKFERFKRRISGGKKNNSVKENKIEDFTMNSNSAYNPEYVLSEKRDYGNHQRVTSNSAKQQAHRAVEYSEQMLNQVVDGMSKMRHTAIEHDFSDDHTENQKLSFSDDHTAATAASTLQSYTRDENSTIESLITTDPSYLYHTFKAGNQKFTVDRRYSMTRTVGSGAYGVVIAAKDHQSNSDVAIKMVPRAFHDEIDAKRILREIKLLKHLRHENIIRIKDMMPPLARNVEDYKDVYIVTDLMETDLHRIIYSKQALSMEHTQFFMYQVLRALKYLHSANILHRDLKPSNLLVNSNCDLKICDFGLARGLHDSHDEDMSSGGSLLLTEYVVTRWYRAPEIMLACHQYSYPSDIWSCGCIFAELMQRKPYLAGEDYIDQLTLIIEKLGKLSEHDMDFITSEKAKRFIRKLPNKMPVPLKRQFPQASDQAIDLLKGMLQINPQKRITVEKALAHPFFESLHNPSDEPIAHAPFDFSFEDEKLHRVRLQELIWEEVGDFRPNCLPVPPRIDGTKPPLRIRNPTLRRLF
jgi:mitogen-activated protein kinase 1/3